MVGEIVLIITMALKTSNVSTVFLSRVDEWCCLDWHHLGWQQNAWLFE
jgi:hypothetical protein